jgi:hypothetical protein
MARLKPFPMTKGSENENKLPPGFVVGRTQTANAPGGTKPGVLRLRMSAAGRRKKMVTASGGAGKIARRIEHPTTLMLSHVQSQGLLTEGDKNGIR